MDFPYVVMCMLICVVGIPYGAAYGEIPFGDVIESDSPFNSVLILEITVYGDDSCCACFVVRAAHFPSK